MNPTLLYLQTMQPYVGCAGVGFYTYIIDRQMLRGGV